MTFSEEDAVGRVESIRGCFSLENKVRAFVVTELSGILMVTELTWMLDPRQNLGVSFA